jgi:hypothetical protein
MVYDSATRLLGYVLSGDDYSVTILTPTNKVHTVTMTTGEPHATPISFLTTSTPTNQTTTPYVLSNAVAPANPSYYYNPNGGGLYFKYAGASVTSHTDQVGEYYYHYDGSLSTSYAGGPYNYYALEWTTESAYNTGVYGFAPTLPLKYSITVLP